MKMRLHTSLELLKDELSKDKKLDGLDHPALVAEPMKKSHSTTPAVDIHHVSIEATQLTKRAYLNHPVGPYVASPNPYWAVPHENYEISY
jgi:hypothetical protein